MSVTPPQNKLWWNEPVPKSELVWVIVAFVWGLVMFFAMVFWHVYGEQNLSNESYRITAEQFSAKTEAMVEKYKVREESGYPVVRPPEGEDIYLIARLWQWWPILELEKGKSYRLHLSSLDWLHGFSLQPVNINVQVHPDYEMVMTIKPTTTGEFGIVCNEYCGIGHHQMLGRMYVVDNGGS